MSLIDFEDSEQAARLKRYLGISVDDTSYDDLLTDKCAELNSKALGILNGRNILADTYTLVRVNGTGTHELCLPHYPLISVSDVRETIRGDFDAATPLVEGDDYEIDPDSGILHRLGAGWLGGHRNIRLTWSGGYETLPDDLFEAAKVCIADMFTRAMQLAGGQSQAELTQEAIKDGRTDTYRPEIDQQWGIPVTALRTFQRYRNPA